MSVQYPAVGWNSYKKRYDLILLAGLILYLTLFVGIGVTLFPYATAETLIIRALGTSAFFLLHVILCIGPLCRLNPRFLPLLYNRRHMGVTMFLLGLGHGVFSIFQFHALGNVNPLYSLLISNRDFASVADFPFQQLGFLALVILFLMAATSHDFWLRNLTPPAWKRLHLLAYASYALLTAHVTLGTLQSETSSTFAVVLALGFVTVISLHLAAAFKEKRLDETKLQAEKDGFLNACAVDRVPEKCATVVSVAGERIAIFRYDGKISALSNVCRHQNGPLGEGQIIDGCVTCPWHGYQYAPDSGASPPPFAEKVATFRIRVVDGRVWLDPKPNPPGTRVEPAAIAEGVSALSEFFVGYLPTIPPGIARMVRRAVMGILLGVVAATIILVASQHRFASAAFEYGKVRDFEGVIEEQPYPVLLVRRPGLVPVDNRYSPYMLVGAGKHGADVAGLAGKYLTLRGMLIYRGHETLIEVIQGSLQVTSVPPFIPNPPVILGPVTLTGEIVDSKCYFGVMNPGEGKVHRDCAARCLSGGIPPAFIALDPEGRSHVYMLANKDGGKIPTDWTADHAGRPITLHGELTKDGETETLHVDLASPRLRP